MIRVKINGVGHEFPQGTKVLEACRQFGIYIPHFCYHPALSVVGSCRMCKVEVIQGGRSRIDISCKLEVAGEMEIITDSDAVKKQQRMTLEYLLANHPLDCPICDDAGECDLQDFYYSYGRYDSRMRELKVSKRKAKDIGRSIVLDSERCVLCSRCVRFCGEVTKTHELGIFGMGFHEELMLRPNGRLDNDYAGNVVDLCPVGALTDKDFRFKRRVWYLQMSPSVCQLCSRGCNVLIDYDRNPFHEHKRGFTMKNYRTAATEIQRIQRIKPRVNEAVNGSWICDKGRYGYKGTDAADRVAAPLLKGDVDLQPAGLPESISFIAKGINAALKTSPGKIAVIASPRLTNEELFAVQALFRGKMNLPNIDHRLPIGTDWTGDNLLKTPDPYPNRTFCEWLNLLPTDNGVGIPELTDAILGGKVDTVISILADPREYLTEAAMNKLKRTYLVLRNLPPELGGFADAILPAASWGEYCGSFTNFQGRLQRLDAAFEPFGSARPVWFFVNELASALKKPLNYKSERVIWQHIGESLPFLQGITLDGIGPEGAIVENEQLKATA